MDRRSFLKSMVGGVAAAAAVRTFPFRVFSFPSEIVSATGPKAIRFIKAYDVAQDRFITRFDVLYGFMKLDCKPGLRLDLPVSAQSADMLSTKDSFLDKNELRTFLNKVIENHKLPLHADGILPMLESTHRDGESIRSLSTAISIVS